MGSVTITVTGASAGLTLPTLPAGWKYEGWTVINGTPVTTGTFTSTTVVDDADPYSSTMPGPPFPGEDFLLNAPAAFTLKPLVGNIPANAVDHTTYMMSTNLSSFPTGTVTR